MAYSSTAIVHNQHLLHRPGVVAFALAPAVPLAMPALLLVLNAATILLPLHRLAVAVVLVPPVPVLHAQCRTVPVPLPALTRSGLAAVPMEDVVMVMVLLTGDSALVLLVRVRVPAMVVVVVSVRVVALASPALRVCGLRRPEHVLPPVVQRVEEALLVEKPQQHRN
jgi:hypothetical protein